MVARRDRARVEMAIDTLIVEDNPTVRRALADLVSADADLEVVGLAADAGEGVQRARELHPGVALVDVKMPGGGGPAATREMLKLENPPRVVAMSASRDNDAIVEMLRAGAVAYLVKGGPADDVRSAIKRAARGEASLSPAAAGRLIETVVHQIDQDETLSAEREEMLARVQGVIDGEGLETAFQPIFDLAGGDLVGYEALARFMAEPKRGPLMWFAEADELGLGRELEMAAIAIAIAAATPQLRGGALEGRFLALNASPATLIWDGFSSALTGEFPLEQVVLEVTEHAGIDDYGEFAEALAGLRERGVRLAVDDVGSGYASLRHILNLEPDFIKLDLTLTHGVETETRKRAMAAALISFARETGCTVIAEGIETERELQALIKLGAHFGQGYHLGRPGPLAEGPRASVTITDEQQG